MDERLGSKIRKNRSVVPFEGMTKEQKRSIEDFLCHIDERKDPAGAAAEEDKKLILLLEYKIEPSPFPGKETRAALRFCERSEGDWGQECYMWTGSTILIDQMQRDFSPQDLPSPTAIHEYENKFRKKFYKFT